MRDRDAEEIWAAVLARVKETFPSNVYRVYLEPTNGLLFDGKTLVVEVPGRYVTDWLEAHYAGFLRRLLREEVLLGEFGDVDLVFKPRYSKLDEGV